MKKILFLFFTAISFTFVCINSSASNASKPKEASVCSNLIPFEIPPLVFGESYDSVLTLLKSHDWTTFEVIHAKKKKGIIELESKISISRMNYWFNSTGMYCIAIFIPKSEVVYSDIRNKLESYEFKEIQTEIDQPSLFVNPDLKGGVQCEVETADRFGELWQLSFTKMEK